MILARFSRTTLLASVLIVGSAIGGFAYFDGTATFAQDAANAGADIPREKLRHALGLSEAFKEVTKSVSPAVVNIRTTMTITVNEQRRGRGMIPEDLLPRLFGDEGDSGPGIGDAPRRQRIGEGSGVVMREDGYIVTNNHVVDDADEIVVRFSDDRELSAKVVGRDGDTDLAVIRVEATGLSAAKFGDSDALEPGEWVLAIGSPFGLDHTVTAGIVSAKGRQIGIIQSATGVSGYEDFIQTDAAINPGNSGGPLVNIFGEVIGINTAISTRTGVYEGVGFAIPSKMVRSVTNQIIEKGRVERGWLGVGIQPITPALAENLHLDSTRGALINHVTPGSPAEESGIQTEDVVVAFNGKPTPTPNDLMNLVADAKPGSKAKIEAIRGGDHKTFEITLAARNTEVVSRGRLTPRESHPTAENLGMAVQTLTPSLARRLNVDDVDGVVVTEVDPDSAADRIGIEPGTIVTRIGDSSIASVEDFNKAMKKQDVTKGVRLHVVSNGTPRVIVLKAAS